MSQAKKMKLRWTLFVKSLCVCLFVSAFCTKTFATENGGTIYPQGIEGFLVAAAPPPGFYLLTYPLYYQAAQTMDNNGNALSLNFNLHVNAVAIRGIWVTNVDLFGGKLVFHTVIPMENIDAEIGPGAQSNAGMGDDTLGTGLAFRPSENFYIIGAVDFSAPTGSYQKNNLVNLGRNYFEFEPLVAMSYVTTNSFNGDIKIMYDINEQNSATQYTSGQEFHFDYAAGWALNNNWVGGIGGYFYQQMTDDQQGSNTVPNNRGSAIALGPEIKYENHKGWFLTAKWQFETAVKNRPEGNGLIVKTNIPLE